VSLSFPYTTLFRSCVSGEVIVQIIFVGSAVPGVGAALGDNRNLHAGGVVEVGSLVGGGDLELLDAVHRGGHHTGRLTAGKAEIAPADLILRVGKQTAGRI